MHHHVNYLPPMEPQERVNPRHGHAGAVAAAALHYTDVGATDLDLGLYSAADAEY